jgi:site-specific DNA-methyltransferase (adenine-specific)
VSQITALIKQPIAHDWETPIDLFRTLDDEFGFVCDAAASIDNALCHYFYSADMDALRFEWRHYDGAVWCNPPYGTQIGKWVAKAAEEGQYVPVVMLIASRTETAYWHQNVMQAAEIRFIRGRLRFSGASINAPFPSAIVVFRPGHEGPPLVSAIERDGRPL